MYQLKRNSGLIFKTFLYQIVMSLFGFMMYSSVYRIPFILVIGQLTITLFFIYIMGQQMFQGGSKACEYDRAHKLSSPAWLGFVFAAIAFIPAILLSLLGIAIPPFTASGAPTGGNAFFLINKFFFQGMYIGIFQWLTPDSSSAATDAARAIANNGQSLYFLLAAIPGILACGIAYLIGYQSFKKDKK